jgi:hypothetical protein
MSIITLYYIPPSTVNNFWYKNLVGRTLNEAQFEEVLFNSFLDFQRIERKVRDVKPN